MRSSSNNNIAEQCLRVPGGTRRWQEKKKKPYPKQLWRKLFSWTQNYFLNF